MANEIISYLEMCQREGMSLQKGMNYRSESNYSVILMSLRPNAPYQDRVEEDGSIVIYEGHDIPRSRKHTDPKAIDQPEFTPSGSLTENGKFHRSAQRFRKGDGKPRIVRAYEKMRQGIWSDNGLFHLVDSWQERDEHRYVFKFKLVAIEQEQAATTTSETIPLAHQRRVIPTPVKLEVWKRDSGKCVICGASDELHFDHIIPVSRGGTSLKADNVQLLCARHNLEKRDNIV